MKLPILLFDVAGVLYNANLAVGEYITEKFGISAEDQKYLWYEIHPKASTGEISSEEYIKLFVCYYNLEKFNVSEEDFTKPFEETIELMEGMDALLRDLSSNGYQLAILSDTTEIFDSVRNKIDIYKHFDKIFVSYKIGATKPNVECYKKVIDDFKLEPSDFVFIDDREQNIKAAIDFGMKGIVFRDTKNLKESLKQLGVR